MSVGIVKRIGAIGRRPGALALDNPVNERMGGGRYIYIYTRRYTVYILLRSNK
jgi:hypothetical protein